MHSLIKHNLWVLAALCILALVSPPALGFQTQQPSQKPESTAEQQEPDQNVPPDAKKPYKAVLNPQVVVSGGYADWDLHGNQNKFKQYATPPEGFFLNRLMLSPKLGRPTSAFLDLKGLGEDDYRLDGRFSTFYGETKATGVLMRNRFFDPAMAFLSPSDRYIQEVFGKQMLWRGFALSARYRMDEQNDYWEPPRLENHSRTRTSLVNAEGRVGPGFLSLGYMDWKYFDRFGTYPDRTVGRWLAGYLWNAAPWLDLEGAYTRHNIAQSGLPGSSIDTVALTGDASIGPATSISLSGKRDTISAPVVQNGYVRERKQGSATLTHRWGRWMLQTGFRRREAERVNGDQTLLDIPKWSTFEGKLRGKLSPTTSLMLRGFAETLNDVPHMTTDDPRSLYWNNRSGAQIRLDTLGDKSDWYAVAGLRRQNNGARGVTVSQRSFTAGGSLQASPTVNAFLEYSLESWQAKTSDPVLQPLDQFMPSASATVLGANWEIDRSTSLGATYTHYTVASENPLQLRDGNVLSDFFTINLHHRFPKGQNIGLMVAPWTYRDRTVGFMNYDTSFVMVTAAGRY